MEATISNLLRFGKSLLVEEQRGLGHFDDKKTNSNDFSEKLC